jgi:hypothetical protein
MAKNIRTHFVIQILVLCALGVMAGFFAITMMGVIGGTAMGVAPDPVFGMVSGIVCPNATLEYSSQQRSFHQPGESEPQVECVKDNGEREDRLFAAILSVLGLSFAGSFVGFFVPGYLVLGTLSILITSKIMANRNQ